MICYKLLSEGLLLGRSLFLVFSSYLYLSIALTSHLRSGLFLVFVVIFFLQLHLFARQTFFFN